MTGPETRGWLKDKIFGEDEEFGYGRGSPAGTPPRASADRRRR
jgi:hypothetical protein